MKILILSTNFPRWQGDTRAPFILGVARALQRMGNQVRVVTMHNPDAALREEMDGVEVRRVRYAPDGRETLQQDAAGIPIAWKRGFKSQALLAAFGLRLTREVLREGRDFDIIHANWSLTAIAARLTVWFHRTPYVVTVHGSDVYKTIVHPFQRWVVRYGLKGAKKVVAVSEDLAKVVKSLGISPEKVEVIGTGISLDEFPFEPNANRKEQIMFVGSLIERKGVNQLLEALTHVQQQVPGCRLLIVGEGVERQHLEQQAEQLGLSGMVTFMGNQSQAEVSRLLRESKVFVLPSIEEGQGVVLVEALASGTPCVGSDVGGIPGVISGVGLVVPPASPTALAEGILRFLKDPDLWQRSSTEGRKRAEEKYDWDVLVRQIVRVYAEVLGNLPPNGVVRVGER